MQEYQKKIQVKKVMYSKATFAILLICIGFLTKGVIGIYSKAQESEKNKIVAELEYAKLAEREAIVSAQISDLKTSSGVEREIRSKFNVAKEGEQIVVIVDKKDTSDAENKNKKKGFLNWIASLFGLDS